VCEVKCEGARLAGGERKVKRGGSSCLPLDTGIKTVMPRGHV